MPSIEVLDRPLERASALAAPATDPAAARAVPVPLALHDLLTIAGTGVAPVGPSVVRAPWIRLDPAFVVVVLMPVLAAAAALFWVVSDRYTSETRFVVRASGGGGATLDGGAGLSGVPLSRTGEDAYVVDDFVRSRDALAEIEARPALAGLLDRPEADVFARFPAVFAAPTREQRFRRFGAMLRTEVDPTTGISTIAVTAFRPGDARDLALALLEAAEGMVNRINGRANNDRTVFAADDVARARAAVTEIEQRLTAFRNASGTVDPVREYAAALGNVGRLALEASQRQAELDQQVALTPNAPGIASQREKVRALHDEIDRANQAIAGGEGSLAVKLESYERLSVERDMAVKALAGAEFSLEASRRDSDRQHLYLQTVAEPNLPDVPSGPRRVLLLLVVAAAGLVAYLGLRQLKGLAEDHVA